MRLLCNKILKIAIAALSIVGSAVAQVTISGQVAVGARKDGAVTYIGRTDGNINVKSVENLGGGLTLTANGGLDLAARAANVNARNLGLSLSSATAGTLTYYSNDVTTLSRLSMGGAVSLGEDLDDLYGAAGQLTAVSYSAPKMGNVTLSYGVSARTAAGRLDTADLSKTAVLGAVYAAGPLSIGVNYSPELQRTRADMSFDAKVAVIEAHMNSSYTGVTDAFSEFGVAVPMGAMTIGAGYSTRGTTSGTAIGVSYALSKQTSIQSAYASLKNSLSAADGAHTSIKLNHTF